MPLKSKAPATPCNRPAPRSRTLPGQTVLPGMSAQEPTARRRVDWELAEQKVLFYWLRQWGRTHPDIAWVHSVPNGLPLTGKVAKDASESGLTSGVWDIFVPSRRGEWAGLYIEMKWGKNGLTDAQKAFLAHLTAQGYQHAVCYSWTAAARVIVDYLGVKDDWIEQVIRVNTKAPVGNKVP